MKYNLCLHGALFSEPIFRVCHPLRCFRCRTLHKHSPDFVPCSLVEEVYIRIDGQGSYRYVYVNTLENTFGVRIFYSGVTVNCG